jgi:hypothetical protein
MPRMLPPSRRQLLVLIALPLLFTVACGEDQSSVTGPSRPVLMSLTTSTGGMAANSSFCHGIRSGADGSVNAVIDPQHLLLRLGPGPCNNPGEALAEATGEVTAVLPAGDHHLRVTNTRDTETQYSLRIRFPI